MFACHLGTPGFEGRSLAMGGMLPLIRTSASLKCRCCCAARQAAKPTPATCFISTAGYWSAPPAARRFPLAEVREAQSLAEKGGVGKVLLTP